MNKSFIPIIASTLSTAVLLVMMVAVSAGCQTDTAGRSQLPVIKEVFHTDRDQGDNVDSPAIWHGPDGQNWLLATAKEGHQIIVFDANDGSLVRRVGSEGAGRGQLQRPNGIAVIDNLMLVIERDNHRIQVFTLPDFTSVGNFGTGEDGLIYPYGVTVDRTGPGTYELFVSDNYNPYLQGYPAEGELEDRIHHYRMTLEGNTVQSEQLNVFGEVYSDGALHKVESLWTDREHDRLLVADEAYLQRNVKVYDLNGNFTGKTIPNNYFSSEPEGIALYKCRDGSGYWIITDQHESEENKFQVFDRESLEYIGGFRGEITRNTDGVWLTQKAFGQFEKGAFYPVHDDGSITAISWADIAGALSLDYNCTE